MSSILLLKRLPQSVLDCSIYLYGSVEAAKEGEAFGGSGFLVGVNSSFENRDVFSMHVYAVTNSHVIREGRSPVIRLNVDGQPKVFPIEESAWIHHEDGDDVAICPLQLPMVKLPRLRPAYHVVMSRQFVSKNDKPIVGPRGINQESFLVEMHSLPGYSGSPVFVYES